jgi:two-component system, sensor histidine kinase and response regulator
MNRSPFAQSFKGDRILVVDDSPDNSFLIQTILQDADYQVDVADSGPMALAKLEQAPPDLVLLDVMMPGMDGYEVTRRIRQNTSLPFIPILLITAYDQLSVAQGLDMGADDFIRKPVEFDELLARVRSLLRLKHSVEERDQIARQREDFVSRLTHDLRTPLVAADRMLTLLQQGVMGDLSDDVQEALTIMIRSNHNLLTLVNTLLEVYRYEAGRKTLNFAPVDLVQLTQEVVKELSPIAMDKGLALNFDPAKAIASTRGETLVVKADRLELHRVLTNLIGNAVKFTDDGSVTVALAQGTSGYGKSTRSVVQIAVQDTGTGIPLAEQSSLFESFNPGKHRRSGSGLGLHLSRRIAEAHLGSIGVQSAPGKGSTFTICLPTG